MMPTCIVAKMTFASVGALQTRNDPQYEGVDEFCVLDFYSGARTELSYRKFSVLWWCLPYCWALLNFWNLFHSFIECLENFAYASGEISFVHKTKS